MTIVYLSWMDYNSETSMMLYYLINQLVKKKVLTKKQVADMIRDIQKGGFNNPKGHPKIAWLDELMKEISYEEQE